MTLTLNRSSLWRLSLTLIALASVYFFCRDLIAANWAAWVIAPLLIGMFYAAMSAARSHELAKGILGHAAMLLVPFMALYSIVDGIADEFFLPDWPELVVVAFAILTVWISVALAVEDDD